MDTFGLNRQGFQKIQKNLISWKWMFWNIKSEKKTLGFWTFLLSLMILHFILDLSAETTIFLVDNMITIATMITITTEIIITVIIMIILPAISIRYSKASNNQNLLE